MLGRPGMNASSSGRPRGYARYAVAYPAAQQCTITPALVSAHTPVLFDFVPWVLESYRPRVMLRRHATAHFTRNTCMVGLTTTPSDFK